MKQKLKIQYRSINLPFQYPFTISKGTKTHQPALVIELDYFGIKGYGEAPAISYYNIPVEKMIADIEAKRQWIESFSFTDPERFWHYLHHLLPGNPFLVCALDMAGWDIYGKLKKMPLYDLWKFDVSKTPVSDYTIGIDSIDEMLAKMKAKPWPVYKIKVGVPGDVQMIAALREHTDAVFRVDANAGWSLEEAKEKIPAMEKLGVQLIEQPLAKDNWEDMKELYNYANLPLIADESCVAENDLLKCVDHFHGINIKLTKCSGITPALRMMQKAREMKMEVMIGCMNEGTIGTAAIAHLAAVADYVDMDGTLLLSEDNGKGPVIEAGVYKFNSAPGLGITTNLFD